MCFQCYRKCRNHKISFSCQTKNTSESITISCSLLLLKGRTISCPSIVPTFSGTLISKFSLFCILSLCCLFPMGFFFLNKKFYWSKIEPPHTQGKEHKNSTDTELKVTTTQCCLQLLFNFLNGFHQFFK